MISVRARGSITRLSLDLGLIPKICPICKNFLSSGKMEEHHWGFRGKGDAVRAGRTRRMCISCNGILSPLYHEVGDTKLYRYWSKRFKEHGRRLYTDGAYTWEEQFSLLSEYFRSPLKDGKYPDFDGIEGYWSRFLPIEERIYKEVIWERGGRGKLLQILKDLEEE